MAFVPAYILILVATIIVDYFAARLIEKAEDRRRKLLLWISIVSNVGFLCIFKYYNFAAENIDNLAQLLHWNYSLPLLSIALPIGLSFHTFQAMSYVIEVYRGTQKAEKHFGYYSLYVLFFPQLVAGPIERPGLLLHQFKEQHLFDRSRIISGLELMTRGFFKKIVIADNAALVVNTVFNNIHHYEGVPLILGTLFFSLQLFCDFSGYTDIARGSARVLGYELMVNFNRPYIAESLADYWRRWHISLSTWFRDYVFQPIAYSGKFINRTRLYLSLIITFTISGLWHGANWTYIIWGFLHGLIMSLSLATKGLRTKFNSLIGLNKLPRLHRVLRVILTLILVTLLLAIFRANSIGDAYYLFTHLLSNIKTQLESIGSLRASTGGIHRWGLITILISICIYYIHTPIIQFIQQLRYRNILLKLSWYGLAIWILYFGAFAHQSFVYFQF